VRICNLLRLVQFGFTFGILLAPALTQAEIVPRPSIFVREEEGLSFFPIGEEWTLTLDGPSVSYLEFDLSYRAGSFQMAALANNDYRNVFPPFALDIYPTGVDPRPPFFDDSNSLGFVLNSGFPAMKGEVLRTPIAPIPEPSTYTLMLAGLALLATILQRRKVRLAAPLL
jgi:PEP-CTERM motif